MIIILDCRSSDWSRPSGPELLDQDRQLQRICTTTVMERILKWLFRIVLVLLVLAGLLVFIAYWRSTNDCDRKNAAAPSNPMKAIVYCDYGLANLKLEEIEKPTPTDDQVLVRVRAASVNPYDWHFVEGSPKIIRLF